MKLNIKLGILAGVISCICWNYYSSLLTPYSLQVEQYRYYTTLLLLVAGIIISIYMEKKNAGGYISFKLALRTGFVYTLMVAFCLGIFNFIYYKYIAIDAIDYFVSEERKAFIAHGKTLEETNKFIIEYYIPTFGVFHIVMSTIILGIILSLITSGILQKKNRTLPFSEN